MAISLNRRIEQALDFISSVVRIAYALSLAAIVLVAALLCLLASHVYPLLIIPILVVAAAAAWYVTSKKDSIADIIDDADEQSAVPPQSGASSHHTLPERLVVGVVDSALETASDTAMLAPAACALVAALFFVFGYNGAGTVAVVVAIVGFVLVSCSCSLVKGGAHAWIDTLFNGTQQPSHAAKPPPVSEKTPLVA